MKNIYVLIFIILLSLYSLAHSSHEFYCLSDGKKSILLVPIYYLQVKKIKYFPYMKDINLSDPYEIEEVDMGDNAQPEIYRSMNEIIDGKITGKYRFMSQGYLLYEVAYTNKNTRKVTNFENKKVKLKGIECF